MMTDMEMDLVLANAEIKKLKALVSEWISVKDRLPIVSCGELDDYVKDKGHRFLVTTEDGYVEIQTFWAKGQCFDYSDVTHWMPLPQPPNEGEEHG